MFGQKIKNQKKVVKCSILDVLNADSCPAKNFNSFDFYIYVDLMILYCWVLSDGLGWPNISDVHCIHTSIPYCSLVADLKMETETQGTNVVIRHQKHPWWSTASPLAQVTHSGQKHTCSIILQIKSGWGKMFIHEDLGFKLRGFLWLVF